MIRCTALGVLGDYEVYKDDDPYLNVHDNPEAITTSTKFNKYDNYLITLAASIAQKCKNAASELIPFSIQNLFMLT